MAINYSSSIVVELSAGRVSGWPGGMGVHRLRFSVEYHSPSKKETLIARNFRALVSVSRSMQQGGAYLGIAWPESAWSVRSNTFGQKAAILFDLAITSEQLALIETLRVGGDLVFDLVFHCEVSSGDDVSSGRQEVRYYVNQSTWVSCMKEFGQDRIVVLEVDLPVEEGVMKTAVTLLKQAREHLLAGNYDGVVQQCRRAIESAQKALNLRDEISAAVKAYAGADRKKMTKRERALLVSETALHYAHLAHHVDDVGQTFDYGRRDAAFMLALASAVVADAAATGE